MGGHPGIPDTFYFLLDRCKGSRLVEPVVSTLPVPDWCLYQLTSSQWKRWVQAEDYWCRTPPLSWSQQLTCVNITQVRARPEPEPDLSSAGSGDQAETTHQLCWPRSERTATGPSLDPVPAKSAAIWPCAGPDSRVWRSASVMCLLRAKHPC